MGSPLVRELRKGEMGVPNDVPGLKLRRLLHQTRGSSSTGRSKGGSCVASPRDRTMAKRSRSYKMREYTPWAEKMLLVGMNRKIKSK